MEKQTKSMTVAEYDACVVAYGADIACWPARKRKKAMHFLKTPKGIDARMLDNLFGCAAPKATLDPESAPADASAFLARLQAIPQEYPRASASVTSVTTLSSSGVLQQIDALIGRLFDPVRLLSPVGLVSQALAVACIMGVGVVIGLQQVPDTFSDYDISAGLFETGSEEYSIDG